MRTVEVFITNVQEVTHANHLIVTLREIFPDYSITFDLDDCDRVLRVQSEKIDKIKSQEIIRLLNSKNFRCEILK
jgi:hypothetical protein